MDKKLIVVGENISELTRLTKNFADVMERLQDYDVLTPSEIKHIVAKYDCISFYLPYIATVWKTY